MKASFLFLFSCLITLTSVRSFGCSDKWTGNFKSGDVVLHYEMKDCKTIHVKSDCLAKGCSGAEYEIPIDGQYHPFSVQDYPSGWHYESFAKYNWNSTETLLRLHVRLFSRKNTSEKMSLDDQTWDHEYINAQGNLVQHERMQGPKQYENQPRFFRPTVFYRVEK